MPLEAVRRELLRAKVQKEKQKESQRAYHKKVAERNRLIREKAAKLGILEEIEAAVESELRKRKPGTPKAKSSEPRAKSSASIRIKWFRSAIAAPVKHKRVVQGLGFTRLNQIIEREDSPSIRGMVNKVPHLVKIVA